MVASFPSPSAIVSGSIIQGTVNALISPKNYYNKLLLMSSSDGSLIKHFIKSGSPLKDAVKIRGFNHSPIYFVIITQNFRVEFFDSS